MLLASCMHAGSRIVRLARSADSGEWEFGVLARFEEHKSMNYGSDVQPVERGCEGGLRTVVSTSFYDKLMCVWEFGEG
jgi:diphthamide biosynthesis protein 7